LGFVARDYCGHYFFRILQIILMISFFLLDFLMQKVEEKTAQEKKEPTPTSIDKQNGPLRDKSEVQNTI
jgi:hypothetical protein